jgi:hypothetical protein
MNDIRELNDAEVEAVSGGAKTQTIIGGFKFTLWDNGDFAISAGGTGVKSNSNGEVLEVRQQMS